MPTMSIRRSAIAIALLGVTITACGTERGGQVQSADPRPSFSSRPKCALPAEAPAGLPSSSAPAASSTSAVPGEGGGPQEESVDRAPHYAENHAYRMRGSLSGEQQAWGAASAQLIRAELEKVRQEGGSGAYGRYAEERIAAALSRLGCGEEHGVFISNGYYSVHTGVVCVSGRVTKDELTTEVHGAYAEPQPGTGPCVENRGGR